MSFIETCLDQLKLSIIQSSLGKNIEIQYHLQNHSSSRNVDTNSDAKPADAGSNLPDNGSNSILMYPETPIFPSSAGPKS